MKGFKNQPVENANMDILRSKNPHIRLFTVKRTSTITPQNDVVGSWKEAAPVSVRATQTLGPDVSFISLTQWKNKNEGIYFIEAAPDTISVISSMFRYWLVDEIILFVAPYIQGDGIRLFTEIPGPSSWEMTGNKCFRSGICRLAYKRIE